MTVIRTHVGVDKRSRKTEVFSEFVSKLKSASEDNGDIVMLVKFPSVINIILCQNVMWVTDMLCWRRIPVPNSIRIFYYL